MPKQACFTNWGSNYGEITHGSVEKCLDKTSTNNWIKAERGGTTITDLGAGYMAPLAYLAKRSPLASVVGLKIVPYKHMDMQQQ